MTQIQTATTHADLDRRRRAGLVVHCTILRLGVRLVRHHVLALRKALPDTYPKIPLLVFAVRLAQQRLDGPRGLFGIILRDAREQVVDDVEVGDVVHQVLAAEPEAAVDRGRGALEEGPGFGLVFGDVGVGVVKVGDGYDPVVDPHVWLDVEEGHQGPADDLGAVVDADEGETDADVGH